MNKRAYLCCLMLAPLLGGCFTRPFQPTPPEYTMWQKPGASPDDVRAAMRACGFPHAGGFSGVNATSNDKAAAEQCMFRNDFRRTDDWKGTCSLHHEPPLPACAR